MEVKRFQVESSKVHARGVLYTFRNSLFGILIGIPIDRCICVRIVNVDFRFA